VPFRKKPFTRSKEQKRGEIKRKRTETGGRRGTGEICILIKEGGEINSPTIERIPGDGPRSAQKKVGDG